MKNLPFVVRVLIVFLVLMALMISVLRSCAHAQEAPVVSNSAARSSTTVHEFRKLKPCPDGPDKGSTSRCHGFVVDHIVPLCFGGKDDPDNMQYQTVEDGLKKDVFEREACALARKCYPIQTR